MNRLPLLLLLILCHQDSFAAIYKCVHAGGKVEYQSTPCDRGHQATIKASGQASVGANTATKPNANPQAAKRECREKEIRINFTAMPVATTLQVIADYAGYKLVADPAISGSGAFNYDCRPWNEVLQDVATKHGLAIKIESGTIFATKR